MKKWDPGPKTFDEATFCLMIIDRFSPLGVKSGQAFLKRNHGIHPVLTCLKYPILVRNDGVTFSVIRSRSISRKETSKKATFLRLFLLLPHHIRERRSGFLPYFHQSEQKSLNVCTYMKPSRYEQGGQMFFDIFYTGFLRQRFV